MPSSTHRGGDIVGIVGGGLVDIAQIVHANWRSWLLEAASASTVAGHLIVDHERRNRRYQK
jgi:hypothetical protein